jgi:hypothetical protein
MANRPFYGGIPKVADSHIQQKDAKRKRNPIRDGSLHSS